jgi:hypothetical protein
MYYGTFSAFSREMSSGENVHILKNFGLIFENAEIGGFHNRNARKSFMVWRLGRRLGVILAYCRISGGMGFSGRAVSHFCNVLWGKEINLHLFVWTCDVAGGW